MARGDLLTQELPVPLSPHASGKGSPSGTGRSLQALAMPIGVVLEFFPCAAALWTLDRKECVFNDAARRLAGSDESAFRADPGLWAARLESRDRENFLAAWRRLQNGERRIVCEYRFAPQRHGRAVALRETAMLLPVSSTGAAAVLSVYEAQSTEHGARRWRDEETVRGLAHRMGNDLQAVRGELDLLHFAGALPEHSHAQIARAIERLHESIVEIMSLEPRHIVRSAASERRPRESAERKRLRVYGITGS